MSDDTPCPDDCHCYGGCQIEVDRIMKQARPDLAPKTQEEFSARVGEQMIKHAADYVALAKAEALDLASERRDLKLEAAQWRVLAQARKVEIDLLRAERDAMRDVVDDYLRQARNFQRHKDAGGFIPIGEQLMVDKANAYRALLESKGNDE